MLAQGSLSPIETARAKLQEQVANFLAGRAKLIRLMNSSSLSIKGQAQGLYTVQTALEAQFQNEIMPKIQSISAGVWDISDVLKIGSFTSQIMRQINDVNRLESQAGGIAPTPLIDTTTMMIGIVPLLAIVGLGGYLLSRR